jgi:UDP-2,3-diacylglucosamine pyrophosphatase LpxH
MIDPTIRHYRTLWLSDLHLGTRDCKAEQLLDFLRRHESDYLYLAGDILDGWQLRKGWYWPQAHNDIVQKLLRKARKGTRIYYIPGNHDEALRQFNDLQLGGITICHEAIHTTADGRRLWVIHGDQFDAVVQSARWLALAGDWAYTLALMLNHHYNRVRRWLGYPYWSLSQYLKYRVKNAVSFISRYEETLAEETRRRGYDGIICGHIHHAEVRQSNELLYGNCGDWVESCTALAESAEGEITLIEWSFTPILPTQPQR